MKSLTQALCIKRKRRDDETIKEEQDKEAFLAVGFGTILHHFPEFLEFVVPFITDRTVSNAVVGSSKNIYNTMRDDLTFKPPWPKNYKLAVPTVVVDIFDEPVFSPDGTQIACIVKYKNKYRILIFHQRYGLLQFYRHADNNNDDHDELGWIPYKKYGGIPVVKYSPDGRFLVSINRTFVTIWDYNVIDGMYGIIYYEQLQEWNIKQEINGRPDNRIDIDVSPCSRYVVKSVLLPDHEYGRQIIFSNGIDGHRSIFIHSRHRAGKNIGSIKMWHPFDGDNHSFITILEKLSTSVFGAFVLSHNNLMIGINERDKNNAVKGMLYSLSNNRLATFQQSFLACNYNSMKFTPDDKFISYINTENKRLLFRDIASCRDIVDPINITCNGVRVESDSIVVINFSPVGNGSSSRRVLICVKKEVFNPEYYIASYFG